MRTRHAVGMNHACYQRNSVGNELLKPTATVRNARGSMNVPCDFLFRFFGTGTDGRGCANRVDQPRRLVLIPCRCCTVARYVCLCTCSCCPAGLPPVMFDSADVSFAHRRRLYWMNFHFAPLPLKAAAKPLSSLLKGAQVCFVLPPDFPQEWSE